MILLSSHRVALIAAFTLTGLCAMSPSGLAQINSTNIAGTGVLQPTASFAAIISGNSSTNGGTNTAIIGAANSIVPGGTRFAFIGAGNFNVMAAGSHSAGMIAGFSNTIAAGGVRAATLGGAFNTNAGRSAVILGGEFNMIGVNSTGAAITAGIGNFIGPDGFAATIGGGRSNRVLGKFAVNAGGQGHMISSNSTDSFIGGGVSNSILAVEMNEGDPRYTNASAAATITGGGGNTITANGRGSFIGGGGFNTNNAAVAVIAGGVDNTVNEQGAYSAIGGGQGNLVGYFGTVPGGYFNVATGDGSFAAGASAQAVNAGAFVMNSRFDIPTSSTNDYSFTVRASGGARFITSANHSLAGVIVEPNATAWTVLSDRASKTDFQKIQPREILTKLAAMPITSWRYKHDPSRRYIGPSAQDFMEAFHLGNNDKGINTLDADGVALAAIQGLAEELKERDKSIEELKSELRALRQQVQSSLLPAP